MPPPQRSISNNDFIIAINQLNSSHNQHSIITTTTSKHAQTISAITPRSRRIFPEFSSAQDSLTRESTTTTFATTTVSIKQKRTWRRKPEWRREKEKEKDSAITSAATLHSLPRKRRNLIGLVLFVFLSCVVPLSTPSTTKKSAAVAEAQKYLNQSILITPAPLKSITSSVLTPSTEAPTSATTTTSPLLICPTAQKWIESKGSFCFTLRQSSFLKNKTELRVREERAIAMFCELDSILERVDCDQPYSVNVDREQCWLCREAYRDWTCAMATDTLLDGRMDCERQVLPCPSCASICHQVMRLCPYLTPDRIQFDELGDATPQVSQYGGHPAFYCPLENFHASDPAYTSDCTANGGIYSTAYNDDPDYVHNLCAADAKFVLKRNRKRSSTSHQLSSYDMTTSVPDEEEVYFPHYSTCCWTYSYSLVHNAGTLEESIKMHGSGYSNNNRVILNCCDEKGICDASDPDHNTTLPTSSTSSTTTGESASTSTTSASPLLPPHESNHRIRNTNLIRTANNQVLGKDGKFRELNHINIISNNEYLADGAEDQEDDDDEEYYEDSSSSAGEFPFDSSGSSSSSSSSNVITKRFLYDNEPSTTTTTTTTTTTHPTSIHRDNNNINVNVRHNARQYYRSEGNLDQQQTLPSSTLFFYYESTQSTTSGSGGSGAGSTFPNHFAPTLLCALMPPLVAYLLIHFSLQQDVGCVLASSCFLISPVFYPLLILIRVGDLLAIVARSKWSACWRMKYCHSNLNKVFNDRSTTSLNHSAITPHHPVTKSMLFNAVIITNNQWWWLCCCGNKSGQVIIIITNRRTGITTMIIFTNCCLVNNFNNWKGAGQGVNWSVHWGNSGLSYMPILGGGGESCRRRMLLIITRNKKFNCNMRSLLLILLVKTIRCIKQLPIIIANLLGGGGVYYYYYYYDSKCVGEGGRSGNVLLHDKYDDNDNKLIRIIIVLDSV